MSAEKKSVDLGKLERAAYLRARGVDPTSPMQLDMWAGDMRAVPNDYARSGLFNARRRGVERSYMQSAVLYHLNKAVTITYTGMELRADDDQLVWYQVIHYARELPLGSPVQFSTRQLLGDLGWPTGGAYYKKVHECIERLKATAVTLSNLQLKRGVGISLINRFEFDRTSASGSTSAMYTVWIDPELMVLYAGQNYTKVIWEGYRKLSSVARKLYDYIASHKTPHPLPLDKFKLMCSSQSKSPSKWAQQVRKACEELQTADLVKSVWVDKARIVIER